MGVGQFQLTLRTHHAPGFDAADVTDAQGRIDAGHIGAGRRERARHARAGIRRAADDLHRLARTGIDRQNLQLVGVRMLFGGQDLGDDERRELLARIHPLDFQADHGERVADLFERGVGIEVIAQPGKGKFHKVDISARQALL